MVSLHLLEESKDDGRGEERCQHILDLVETYGRMSGPGKGEDEEDDEEDGEDEDEDGSNGVCRPRLVVTVFTRGRAWRRHAVRSFCWRWLTDA